MKDKSQKLGEINAIILHSAGSSLTSTNDSSLSQQTDQHIISLWLHGRSPHTQKAYSADVKRLMKHTAKKLNATTLGDLQVFADALVDDGLQPSSQHRILAAVKSLITFAHKIGYLPFDVSKPLKVPKFRDSLAERILSEAEVQRMIGMESHPRNHLLLRVLYAGGIRVSELCRLTWKDLQPREDGGQMTVYGKGGKTNVILIPNPLWEDLLAYRGNASDMDPLFKSRKGGSLHAAQVWRIVRKSARRAGISKPVSPHYLRHSHASHALERGCSISLVARTLSHSSIQTTGRYLHAKPSDCSSRYLQV